MKGKKDYSKFFFILIFLVMIFLVFLIVKSFIPAILTAVVVSYIFYPVYARVNKILKRKNLSSLIVSFLVVLLITLPLFFALNAISKEARVNYILLKQKILGGEIVGVDCKNSTTSICKISNSIEKIIADPQTKYYLDSAAQKITTFIIDSASTFLFSVPMMILNLFIIIFTMFYLFRDGKELLNRAKNLLPLKKAYKERLFKKFDDVVFAVVYGNIFVALIQGALGGIGFFIFGISAPVLWGIMMAFTAIVPFIGPPIIWLPAALLQILNGYSAGDNSLIVKGVLLILYGTLIVGTIDNILKPRIIGRRAKVHPILVLLGVLGGLKIFGFIGMIVGPVLLALFMTFVKIYEEGK